MTLQGLTTAVAVGLGTIKIALSAAVALGAVGNPDWLKYANAGLTAATQLNGLISDIASGKVNVDAMTEAEIQALLMPADWDDLVAKAKAAGAL